jgi:hypothetical protein
VEKSIIVARTKLIVLYLKMYGTENEIINIWLQSDVWWPLTLTLTLDDLDIGWLWHRMTLTLDDLDIGWPWHWMTLTLTLEDLDLRWPWHLMTLSLDDPDLGWPWPIPASLLLPPVPCVPNPPFAMYIAI